METSLNPVAPVRPVAAYVGGKRNLAGRLVKLIGSIEHRSYIEPFVGMGGIFLRRTARPPVEVINDLSGDVANLFRVARRHYEPLVDELAWLLASRAEFDRQQRVDPTTLTDIERAVRFLYLQRLAFGGRVEGRTFGMHRDMSSRVQHSHLRAELRALHQRLEPVTIEQLPFGDVIRRYDAPGALFYLDPPYDGTRGYGPMFGRDDYLAMVEQLAGIRGRFLISINDTPFIRTAFARFDVQEIETTWSLSSASAGRGMRVTELLIRNR